MISLPRSFKLTQIVALAAISFGSWCSSLAQPGLASIAPFGEPDTSTYGQTFMVPTGYDHLDSFSFMLRSLDGGNVDFAAYVAEWDGWKYTGPLLYVSGPQVLLAGTTVFTPFTFTTGHLLLDPAKTYVAFLSAANFFDGIQGSAAMAGVGDVYAPGSFVYFNNNSDFSLLHTSEWEETGRGALGDAAFTASFTATPVNGPGGITPSPFALNFMPSPDIPLPTFVAVPEASTYGVMGVLALGALVAVRRFRSRSKTERP